MGYAGQENMLKPGYDKWNAAISGFFFSATVAGKPVYLQVDRETLCQVGPQAGVAPEQAEESFVRAVRSKVSGGGTNPFFRFLWMEDWRVRVKASPATPPPFVGLLALSVLAASRMAADPDAGITAGNYYARLNELLDLPRNGKPPAFEKVSELWHELGRWLSEDNGERLGLPTAVPHPTFRYIGYPISQVLLRDADRRKLPDFFEFEGLAPGQDANVKELVPRLRSWAASGRCSLSRQACKVVSGGEELARQAGETVAAELRSWDGASVGQDGRSVARIEVRVEARRGGRHFQYELYPRAPAGFPDGTYRNGVAQADLERVPGTAWFSPLPASLAASAPGSGLSLCNGRHALHLSGSRVLVLEENDEISGWVSCPRIVSGQQTMVLCHSALAGPVEERLRLAAQPGWSLAPGTSGLPASWVCFRGVRMESYTPPVGEDAELDCLIPRWRAGTSFSGGLKVSGDTWLLGGEPVVTVTASEDRQDHVLLDGEPVGFLAGGTLVLDLAKMGLGTGEHEIAVGEQRRRFRLAKSGYGGEPPGTAGRLGHAMRREGDALLPYSPGAGEVPEAEEEPEGSFSVVGIAVSGAPGTIPDAIREALRLPRGYKRYAVLGSRPGEVMEYELGAGAPYWALKEAAALVGHFEVPVTFEPQWVAAIGTGRTEYLWPVGHPRPPGEPSPSGDTALWIWWARKRYRSLKGKRKQAAWERYRVAARAMDGGR